MTEAVKVPLKNGPSWRYRRYAIFVSLLFAMAAIIHQVILPEAERTDKVIESAFDLIGFIIFAYIGGAAGQDVFSMSKWKK